jgi:hypothetical protein
LRAAACCCCCCGCRFFSFPTCLAAWLPSAGCLPAWLARARGSDACAARRFGSRKHRPAASKPAWPVRCCRGCCLLPLPLPPLPPAWDGRGAPIGVARLPPLPLSGCCCCSYYYARGRLAARATWLLEPLPRLPPPLPRRRAKGGALRLASPARCAWRGVGPRGPPGKSRQRAPGAAKSGHEPLAGIPAHLPPGSCRRGPRLRLNLNRVGGQGPAPEQRLQGRQVQEICWYRFASVPTTGYQPYRLNGDYQRERA